MVVLGVRAARMHDTTKRIERRLARTAVRVSSAQLDQLADYLVLLERWNTRMNLTALDDQDAAVDRLIVEPVLASVEIDAGARSLIDIGSGGGSPAVPLKVMRPDVTLTMVEVKTRKSVFLREAARHLGLSATTVETTRFEDLLSKPAFTGAIDTISVRAVRAETQQLALFGEALRPGGQQLWFLSGNQPTAAMPAPLRIEREVPLVASLQSRLLVVRRD
jgi:16S rRNA (guanine527-N7)-methyltransferase